MSKTKNRNSGCGCANIPISVILLVLGAGYWWLIHQGNFKKVSQAITDNITIAIPGINSEQSESPATSSLPKSPVIEPGKQKESVINSSETNATSAIDESSNQTELIPKAPLVEASQSPTTTTKNDNQNLVINPITETNNKSQTNQETRAIRGIYVSRYQITNNASEAAIREKVRHYHSQGINTIIHGIWGNACTMYKSEVMKQTFGYTSCPNMFQDRWLDWLIDEAHKHNMEVHAYFEKGIKIDENSPIFDLAIERKWVVPGVDRTYPGVEHYILDVEIPEVANFFRDILVEFVQKYPTIDAVQWDDYLGYHAELPGKVNRINKLTKFVQEMIRAMKQANPNVSFDLCHHNPYWAKKYFAADWNNWDIDRAFIQVYNDQNFLDEMKYVEQYDGIAVSDNQLHRMPEIVANKNIKAILVFPTANKPEDTASQVKQFFLK